MSISDKVQVIKGELTGAQGKVVSIEAGQVHFRPSNLDGFDDILVVDASFVDKYFEQGDSVRILQGNYRGETGIITEIKGLKGEDGIVTHPIVKLDKT